jgi:tetrahydromethanopterin S-methyltransferase subunit D
MPAVFTIANRPAGYDQTQKKFTLTGTTAITGTYTSGTGFTPNFASGILNSDGSTYVLPPTYDGPNGPGSGIPQTVWTQNVGGYTINWLGGALRIYSAAGTELTTGTVPAAISAAGIFTEAIFLRG